MYASSCGLRLITALGILLLPGLSAGPAEGQELLPGEYRVSSLSSGLCLDAERGSRNAGSLVQQFDCHGGLNQRLRLLRFGDSWVLRAMHSDLCLTVDSEGVMTQADCDGTAEQFFEITAPEGEGARSGYRISIGSRCLEEGGEASPYRVGFRPCATPPTIEQAWSLW
jgi:hypothetical protein